MSFEVQPFPCSRPEYRRPNNADDTNVKTACARKRAFSDQDGPCQKQARTSLQDSPMRPRIIARRSGASSTPISERQAPSRRLFSPLDLSQRPILREAWANLNQSLASLPTATAVVLCQRASEILQSPHAEAEMGALIYFLDRGRDFDVHALSFVSSLVAEITGRLQETEQSHRTACASPILERILPSGRQNELLRILCRLILSPQGRFSKAGASTILAILPFLPISDPHKLQIKKHCEEIAGPNFGIKSSLMKIASPGYHIDPSMYALIASEWLVPERDVSIFVTQWSILKACFTFIEQEDGAMSCFAIAPMRALTIAAKIQILMESLSSGRLGPIPLAPIVLNKLYGDGLHLSAPVPDDLRLLPVYERVERLALHAPPFSPDHKTFAEAFGSACDPALNGLRKSPLLTLLVEQTLFQMQNSPKNSSLRNTIFTFLVDFCCPADSVESAATENFRKALTHNFFILDSGEEIFEYDGKMLVVGRGKQSFILPLPQSKVDRFKYFLESVSYIVNKQGEPYYSIQEFCKAMEALIPYHPIIHDRLKLVAESGLTPLLEKLSKKQIYAQEFKELDLLAFQQVGGDALNVFAHFGIRNLRLIPISGSSCFRIVCTIQSELGRLNACESNYVVIQNMHHVFSLTPVLCPQWKLSPTEFQRFITDKIFARGRQNPVCRQLTVEEVEMLIDTLEATGDPLYIASELQSCTLHPYALAAKIAPLVGKQTVEVYPWICELFNFPEALILGVSNYMDDHVDNRQPVLLVAQYDRDDESLSFYQWLDGRERKVKTEDLQTLEIITNKQRA